MIAQLKTEIVLVTPEIAAHWLANSPHNRPRSKPHIAKLSKAMLRGEWMLNGEPIIFFNTGELADGQHRLCAIIKSETSQLMVITKGIEKESFKTINLGKSRGSSDILALSGEINSNVLSASVRAYMAYSLTGKERELISPSQILNCLSEHPEIRYWVARTRSSRSLRLFPSALAAYLTLAADKFGPEKVEEFLNQLSDGIGLAKGSPALLLRDQLLNKTSRRLIPQTKNAFIIKALVAHMNERTIPFLRWHAATEPFPVI